MQRCGMDGHIFSLQVLPLVHHQHGWDLHRHFRILVSISIPTDATIAGRWDLRTWSRPLKKLYSVTSRKIAGH